MAYDGDMLKNISAHPCMFDETFAVVVTGVTQCGHMLLNLMGKQGWYFHVARVYDYPRIMGFAGYKKYLKENSKKEVNRRKIKVPKPEGSIKRLEELMGKKWLWGVLPHNCASFVETIVQAGGSDFGLISNCPRALD
jgi:hypothetical protein